MFHRSITGKETPRHEPIDPVEISSISQRIKARPNSALKPTKPLKRPINQSSLVEVQIADLHFYNKQSSTIDPRTTNMESQIESRLSKERTKAQIGNRQKWCCQNHRFPEAKADESGVDGATDPWKPKLATTMQRNHRFPEINPIETKLGELRLRFISSFLCVRSRREDRAEGESLILCSFMAYSILYIYYFIFS